MPRTGRRRRWRGRGAGRRRARRRGSPGWGRPGRRARPSRAGSRRWRGAWSRCRACRPWRAGRGGSASRRGRRRRRCRRCLHPECSGRKPEEGRSLCGRGLVGSVHLRLSWSLIAVKLVELVVIRTGFSSRPGSKGFIINIGSIRKDGERLAAHNSNGGVLDDDFTRSRLPHLSLIHLEWLRLRLCDPGSFIQRHILLLSVFSWQDWRLNLKAPDNTSLATFK
ncbi:hypothetical protein MPH_01702 [Macrophomina phaseolina MS6]|uniref:Uncharacterized protein n=1 Tax=Macrophomina phaseolina (strain MS6) TaxID=1126212 RepID=K2S7U7_MACPH|nr:hypothetical protein MPH_01702 [Macrophomina phaseolina MS6]